MGFRKTSARLALKPVNRFALPAGGQTFGIQQASGPQRQVTLAVFRLLGTVTGNEDVDGIDLERRRQLNVHLHGFSM